MNCNAKHLSHEEEKAGKMASYIEKVTLLGMSACECQQPFISSSYSHQIEKGKCWTKLY